ncbi:hypothetical protein J4E93_005982 [Alternaria ventricosa]|uniref:uncharacterized protein n=1 Tax=Alternaria ventricosa TaxID=1187951 RepID=UPI0020C353C8|nr:uncharacterized protein J4E93_005982 [Alternaria ventricosa]KAI4645182.1 hypothetical protein J4E93_005982 [Alternaria ventricosa]
MGELPETHEDLPFGFLTLPSESAMNAAGRTSDHPFKDLRSARRVRQRSKRYPERIYSGNKRRRNDRYRLARENQLRHESQQADIQEWEDDCYDRWAHEVDMEYMDDIEAYELFGKNAHIFEGTATGDITSGEDFGTWARRRIAEMRHVKEHRIHTYGEPTSPAPLAILPHTMCDDRRPGRVSATISTAPFANPHETTLPTSLSEIRAHATLACILTLPKILKQRCRSRNEPALPVIPGFWWWGEYTWQWHRNLSGCCLVEWVKGELRERMGEDEALLEKQREGVEEEKLNEYDQGWDSDLSDWGDDSQDGYVILGEEHDGSKTWCFVSGIDEDCFNDHDLELVG